MGLTDCLNFGNPENPEVAWEFREAVRGIAEACRALEVPVVSGNVSFYNETEGESIYPTPTIAMVGLISELQSCPVSEFRAAGDRVVLLGADHHELGGSAYLRLLHGIEAGRPPLVELDCERRLAELLRGLAVAGRINTAHDLSTGGLAVALAEACFGRDLGVSVEVDLEPTALFSESQARALLAVPRGELEAVLAEAERFGVAADELGEVTGSVLDLSFDGGRIRTPVAELRQAWEIALPQAIEGDH